jgi:hypothetical protein
MAEPIRRSGVVRAAELVDQGRVRLIVALQPTATLPASVCELLLSPEEWTRLAAEGQSPTAPLGRPVVLTLE